MFSPTNYNINIPNPVQAGLQGYQQGMALQDYRQEMAAKQAKREQAQRMQEEEMAAKQAKREQAQRMQEDLVILSAKKDKTANDYISMMTKYPSLSQDLTRTLGNLNAEQRKNMVNSASQVFSAVNSGDTEYAKQIIDRQVEAYRNSGDEQTANQMQAMRHAIDANPDSTQTALGIMLAGAMGPEVFGRFLLGQQGSKRPSRSEILPDGTSIVIDSSGKPIVKDASGNLITDKKEIKNVIEKANQYGINVAAMKKAAEKEAEIAAVTGQKYADRLDKISEQIGTIDEAINIVSEGIENKKDLGVGPIRKFLPAFSKSANELKNVGSRLGLGVIQSATFGALSEGELKMALETAMPRNLSGKNLLGWLEKRKAAQEKLAGYLQEAATFIGSPKEDGTGVNTVRDWVRMQKEGVQPETMPASQQEQYQTVTTQKQYDALPSGAIFIEDGKKYRKP